MHTKDIFVELFERQISTLYFERIAPEVIFIYPPEKLVIEVRCRGRYSGISWDRLSGSIDRSLLSNHDEIYTLGRTTEADLDLYQAVLLPSPPSFQNIEPTNILDFIVTLPGLDLTICKHSKYISFLLTLMQSMPLQGPTMPSCFQ